MARNNGPHGCLRYQDRAFGATVPHLNTGQFPSMSRCIGMGGPARSLRNPLSQKHMPTHTPSSDLQAPHTPESDRLASVTFGASGGAGSEYRLIIPPTLRSMQGVAPESPYVQVGNVKNGTYPKDSARRRNPPFIQRKEHAIGSGKAAASLRAPDKSKGFSEWNSVSRGNA